MPKRLSINKICGWLKENNYADSASLDKILEYLEKNNAWPKVDFE